MWSSLVRTGVEWVKMNDRSCHYKESRACTKNYEKKQYVFRALRQDKVLGNFDSFLLECHVSFQEDRNMKQTLKDRQGFPWWLLMVKNLPAMQKTWV